MNVVNNGLDPAFIVAIGDDSEVNVIYTAPSIAPYWYPSVVSRAFGEADTGVFSTFPWFTPPSTSTDMLWDDYFPTTSQCLVWLVNQEDQATMPGPDITEFRHLIGTGAKRAVYGPLFYVVGGNAGTVLGSGVSSVDGIVPITRAGHPPFRRSARGAAPRTRRGSAGRTCATRSAPGEAGHRAPVRPGPAAHSWPPGSGRPC